MDVGLLGAMARLSAETLVLGEGIFTEFIGRLFVKEGTDVYEGMIVGQNKKQNDINVNICREKKLTNIRAAGSDENIILTPVAPLTIEGSIAWIADDEVVEITPKCIRLRKRILNQNARSIIRAPRRDTE
ncbi:MAG: hypothetical protein HY537_04725 [Deltaproteobacteria bacterium]|nr:hypothetical protein [Deltaproteobacteria bacterium]